MKRRVCPKCKSDTQNTYDPYEYRCTKCGFWFDMYAGKEITFTDRKPEVIQHGTDEYIMGGHRIGEVVEICYMPKMEGVVVGRCREKHLWLVEHTIPNGGYSVFTEDFLDYINSAR